jgi:ribose/xylose/arabinose/galactoside ABC-type transport system permease subunit
VSGVPEQKSTGSGSLMTRLRPFTGVIALVVLCVIFGSRERTFVSPENFFNILNAMAIIGILAVGQTFPLIGGGFDLSQGAIASFSGAVVASLLSKHGQPISVAVVAGLATGAALGGVNGTLVAKLGINPFVATLGTQIAFFGITNVYTDNQPMGLGTQADAFRQLSFGHVGQFSYASLLFLGLVLLLVVVLRLLPFGQYVYVLGGNEEAARLAGIPTDRIKISTYVLSGLLASVGGLVMIARAGQASPVAGVGYELQSLASCIVGGIALGGGVGSAWNVLLGALTLGVVDVGLQMAVNAPNWRPVIQGLIILLAVAVDARARARR